MRVRLDLAYDGTAFSGWATQPGQRSVQEVLEGALGTVLRTGPPRTTVAGRTDAGVHATGQVAHLDLPGPPTATLLRALNGLLPPDVRVRRVAVVPPAFDARFAATGRSYSYRVTDAVPDPLRRHDTVAWPRPLSAERMTDAARLLLGVRDFAAYCRRRDGATTVRGLRQLETVRVGDVLTTYAGADAFCHSMVRALVGALLAVGDGRRDVGWPAQILAAGVRDPRVTVAPARGLTLVAVDYPADEAGLLARQRESRQLRVAEAAEVAVAEGVVGQDVGPRT